MGPEYPRPNSWLDSGLHLVPSDWKRQHRGYIQLCGPVQSVCTWSGHSTGVMINRGQVLFLLGAAVGASLHGLPVLRNIPWLFPQYLHTGLGFSYVGSSGSPSSTNCKVLEGGGCFNSLPLSGVRLYKLPACWDC